MPSVFHLLKEVFLLIDFVFRVSFLDNNNRNLNQLNIAMPIPLVNTISLNVLKHIKSVSRSRR